MALIDTGNITDITVLRAITADPDLATRALRKVDLKIKAAVRFCGLKAEDIPVDGGTGYTTSEVLQLFGEAVLCSEIMLSLKGGVDRGDTYEDKRKDYLDDAEKYKKQITAETVLENEIVKAASRVRSRPCWG